MTANLPPSSAPQSPEATSRGTYPANLPAQMHLIALLTLQRNDFATLELLNRVNAARTEPSADDRKRDPFHCHPSLSLHKEKPEQRLACSGLDVKVHG